MSWEGQSAEHRLLPACSPQVPLLHHRLCFFGVSSDLILPDKLKPVCMWGGGPGGGKGRCAPGSSIVEQLRKSESLRQETGIQGGKEEGPRISSWEYIKSLHAHCPFLLGKLLLLDPPGLLLFRALSLILPSSHGDLIHTRSFCCYPYVTASQN